MIVYNITMKIDPEIKTEWLEWQKSEHIPDVMATGLFTSYNFFHLLNQDETDGITYVIQYFASSIENYDHYIKNFALQLRQKALEKWKDGIVAFRSVMEFVQ